MTSSRSNWRPALTIITIAVLAIVAISTGQSDAPDIVAEDDYPHVICTFTSYCEGGDCQRGIAQPVIAYISHDDGQPRLEVPRMSPRATITKIDEGLAFESTGGAVEGTLKVFRDGGMDFVGSSVGRDGVIEHYASGRCEPVHVP